MGLLLSSGLLQGEWPAGRVEEQIGGRSNLPNLGPPTLTTYRSYAAVMATGWTTQVLFEQHRQRTGSDEHRSA